MNFNVKILHTHVYLLQVVVFNEACVKRALNEAFLRYVFHNRSPCFVIMKQTRFHAVTF